MFRQLLRQAKTAQVPGATRGVVVSAFTDEIIREARKSRESVAAVKWRAQRDPAVLSRLAAAALDALALQDPVDKETILKEIEAIREMLEAAARPPGQGAPTT
jgi:hypothetical protein